MKHSILFSYFGNLNSIVHVYLTHITNFVNRLTTITIREDNYRRLKKLGETGETFNTVLGRLLDQVQAKESRK